MSAVDNLLNKSCICRHWACVVLAVAGLSMVAAVPPAWSGVLDRIAESGQMVAGTRADTPPFASRRAGGGFEGFSVDLLEILRAAVEAEVGRPVSLELRAVTPADRLDRVADGELHIVCGITTPTWEREAVVDFTVPFFRDGTRVLSYRETVEAGVTLDTMRIGVAQGTTTSAIVAEELPTAAFTTYPDMDSAMAALAAGEIDGVSNIGVALLGLASRAEPRRSVVLLPRTAPLGTEALSCVVPEDDSDWRDLINHTLVGLYDGIGDYRGAYVDLYDRWFGRDGVMVYPLDRSTRDYLEHINIWAQ